MPKFNTMQAGKYYVGDLCYVMGDRWDEVCKLIICGDNCLDGNFNLKDGTRFSLYSTAWGDGSYFDNRRREYLVDSGSIGCIRVEDVTDLKAREQLESGTFRGGHVIEFVESFSCDNDKGIIRIGNVIINTTDSDVCVYCDSEYCEGECQLPEYEDEDEEEHV